MSRDQESALLRRYVLERAAGRTPRKEHARLDVSVGAWIRCDEALALASEHWRRLRRPAEPWCPVLGKQTRIFDDDALQAFFATVPEDGWQQMATRVGKRPGACLREFKESGRRILDAVSGDNHRTRAPLGKLAGWPLGRGKGRRGF